MTLADLVGRVWEEAEEAHAAACDNWSDEDQRCAAIRSRLREALRALVEAWEGRRVFCECDSCKRERTAALKKLEE